MGSAPRDAQWYKQLEERKERELRKRLVDLLGYSHAQSIDELSYGGCVRMVRWAQSEAERYSEWHSAVDPDRLRGVASTISNLLNGERPCREVVEALLSQNQDIDLVDLIMQVHAEGRSTGVSDYMRGRGKKKSEVASEKHKAIAWKWLEYSMEPPAGSAIHSGAWRPPSKNALAVRLGNEFHLAPSTVRNEILRGIEFREDFFPDGIEAAKEQIAARWSPGHG